MKFSATALAIAGSVAMCATAATAFTVGPQGNGLISAQQQQQQSALKNNNRLGATFLRMDTDEFAKSEVASNDVSGCFERI
jgi:hypothetical protein